MEMIKGTNGRMEEIQFVKSGKSAHMVQIVKNSRKNNIKYQKIQDLCSSFDVGILGNFHGLL